MQTSPYVEQLRTALVAAAEAGGAEARRTADLLVTAVEPALRLVLLDVLADAGEEIGEQVGTPVSVRLGPRGAVDLVVDRPAEPEPVPVDDGGELARVTLRIPQPLKDAVDRMASTGGQSVNAFLAGAVQRAVDRALDPSAHGGSSAFASRSTRRVSGWARS